MFKIYKFNTNLSTSGSFRFFAFLEDTVNIGKERDSFIGN